MTEPAQPPDPHHPNIRLHLQFHGALFVGLGVLALYLLPEAFRQNPAWAAALGLAPNDYRPVIDAALFAVVRAVWFIALGLAVFRGRRWGCDLALATCFLWLGLGVVETVQFFERFGGILQSGGSQNAPGAAPGGVMFAILMQNLLLPGLLVWFYSGRGMRAHAETQDHPILPAQLPVVVLCLFFIYAALQLPSALAFNAVIPVFGKLLTGFPGAALLVSLFLSFFIVAAGLALNRLRAWNVAVVLLGLCAVSSAISTAALPAGDVAVAMGVQWPADSSGRPLFQNSLHSHWTTLGLVGALLYTLYVRPLMRRPLSRALQR